MKPEEANAYAEKIIADMKAKNMHGYYIALDDDNNALIFGTDMTDNTSSYLLAALIVDVSKTANMKPKQLLREVDEWTRRLIRHRKEKSSGGTQ